MTMPLRNLTNRELATSSGGAIEIPYQNPREVDGRDQALDLFSLLCIGACLKRPAAVEVTGDMVQSPPLHSQQGAAVPKGLLRLMVPISYP